MTDQAGSQTLESMSQAVWYNQWTLDKFKGYLKGSILEVGCGIGNFTKTLVDFGKVWAIDIQDRYIRQAEELTNGKVKIGFGDIEKGDYFFQEKEFDSEICINVLEHIEDDEKTLKNLYVLLKNNGYLILIVPSHPFLYGKIDSSIGHFRRYTKNNIKEKTEKAGFRVIKCRRINFLGGLGWFLAGRIFSDSTVSETKIKIFNFLAPTFLPLENIIEPPIATSILMICKKETK